MPHVLVPQRARAVRAPVAEVEVLPAPEAVDPILLRLVCLAALVAMMVESANLPLRLERYDGPSPAARAFPKSMGIRTVKTVRPGAEWKSMVPPWRSTIL